MDTETAEVSARGVVRGESGCFLFFSVLEGTCVPDIGGDLGVGLDTRQRMARPVQLDVGLLQPARVSHGQPDRAARLEVGHVRLVRNRVRVVRRFGPLVQLRIATAR